MLGEFIVRKLGHRNRGGGSQVATHPDGALEFKSILNSRNWPEFIVYAINPATGKEEDLLYATLGDYLQSIPPYAIGFPTGIWQFPIVLIVSDEKPWPLPRSRG